jgi:hypothetical protein
MVKYIRFVWLLLTGRLTVKRRPSVSKRSVEAARIAKNWQSRFGDEE